jgi:hypothetical protein
VTLYCLVFSSNGADGVGLLPPLKKTGSMGKSCGLKNASSAGGSCHYPFAGAIARSRFLTKALPAVVGHCGSVAVGSPSQAAPAGPGAVLVKTARSLRSGTGPCPHGQPFFVRPLTLVVIVMTVFRVNASLPNRDRATTLDCAAVGVDSEETCWSL